MTPDSRPRGGLRLWRIGPALALTFAAAIAVAAAVFYSGWDLLGSRSLKPERQLTSSTLFDLVKLAFGVVAGSGALVALVVAYRRQRVDEEGARREDEAALRDVTRLHTERFTTAVSQLGNESAAVRLGGVHALAGLADDAPTRDLRQTCIDVLCGYIRLAYRTETDLPPDDTDARHAYLSLREVRHTVIRLIGNHLRLDTAHPHCWQGHDFDFTNAVFDGGNFNNAVFRGGMVSFSNAVFSSGTVDFSNAVFGGGMVDFSNAVFNGGTVDFTNAVFSGAWVQFVDAMFSSGKVDFTNANFNDGPVDFVDAVFGGGTVDFTNAVFSGVWVQFRNAMFSGSEVDFTNAKFNDGTVDFNYAELRGGMLSFVNAEFNGGEVSFINAVAHGGRVDFLGVRGTASSDQGVPTGLVLPSEWTGPGGV